MRLSQWFSGKDPTCSAGDRGVKSLHHVWLFVTSWTVAYQAPLSMGFSRQQWVAISFSRGSSWPRNRTWVSHIAGTGFTVWATTEAQETAGDVRVPWRRAWQPTSVFLLGKSHEQRSLVGYSPWGSDVTETAWHTHTHTHTHTHIQMCTQLA